MIISDRATGTFLFTRERERGGGSVAVQIWAPYDYLSLKWDAISYGAEDSLGDWYRVVAAAWTIDERGEERELRPRSEDPDRADAGAQLTLLRDYPVGTPRQLKEAVEERERAKRAAWAETARILSSDSGQTVWLRLVGGAAVVGRVEQRTPHLPKLNKAYKWDLGGATKLKDGYFTDAAEVVAAKAVERSYAVPGPEFGAWMKETDEASTTPQLRTALCPECINAVKLPWRSGPCCECRVGRRRDIPESFYFPSEAATSD